LGEALCAALPLRHHLLDGLAERVSNLI
jgi:hypothetical protein